MFLDLLPRLACPLCRGALVAPDAGRQEPLEEGVLACPEGHRFPVTRAIPRLLPAARAGDDVPAAAPAAATRRAFERQWRHYGGLGRIFGKSRREMRENLGNERMGARIRPRWYVGKWVLDAGCGHGRYLREFAALGAVAVGIDVGTGPESAGVPLSDPSVHVVQGDVLRLPFKDGAFDLAFCDGVLHHTPDPRGGFRELARVVRPGGAVYVWLYPREGALREGVFGAARALTTRLPGPLVRALCFAIAPLTLFVRSYSGTKFPRATWAECAQVAHDWLAPPLQSHHTFEEVIAWAREESLVDVERLPIPVGIVAWKRPASSPVPAASPA